MTKDVMNAIRERRSVRRFENRDIPEATITRLLEAATWAPSAGLREPWRFYLVRSPSVKEALVDAAYGQSFIAEAPWVIVVCAEPGRSAARYGQRGATLYCIQDTAAACQNIMLAAFGFGLGTCWVGAFDEFKAARAIGVDGAEVRPVAIIPVGYPAERPSPPRRRPLTQVVFKV